MDHVKLTIWNEGTGSAVVSSIGCTIIGGAESGKELSIFYTGSGSKIVSPGHRGSFLFDFQWAYLGEPRFSTNEDNSRILPTIVAAAHAFGDVGGGFEIECQLWYDYGEQTIDKRTWIYFDGYDLLSYASVFEERFID